MWLGNPKETQPVTVFRGMYHPKCHQDGPYIGHFSLATSCLSEGRASGHLPLGMASKLRSIVVTTLASEGSFSAQSTDLTSTYNSNIREGLRTDLTGRLQKIPITI